MTDQQDKFSFNIKAPQWVDFETKESSDVDGFFEEQLELRSTNGSTLPSNDHTETPPAKTQQYNSYMNKNDEHDSPGNRVLDKSKNACRVSMPCTPLSALDPRSTAIVSNESQTPQHSLINAMDNLQIKSAKRQSATPSGRRAHLAISTSTPLLTTKERLTLISTPHIGTDNCRINESEEARDLDNINSIKETVIPTKSNLEASSSCKNVTNDHVEYNLVKDKTAGQSNDLNLSPIVAIDVQKAKSYRLSQSPFPGRIQNVNKSSSRKEHENVNSVIEKDRPAVSPSENPNSSYSDDEDNYEDAELKLSKIETGLNKNEEKKSERKSKKPRVVTSQVRRQSLKYRRRSGKYVSTAEAILKFERGTPKRFRTWNSKNLKAGPSREIQPVSRKVTCPSSPVLRCKARSRLAGCPNQQEKEMPGPPKPKKIVKKPTSLTEKLSIPEDKESNPPQNSGKSQPEATKNSNPLSVTDWQKGINKRAPKKIVKTVISTEQGPNLKEIEICNFGVPVTGARKKITRAKPFSFENRGQGNKKDGKSEAQARTATNCSSTKTSTRKIGSSSGISAVRTKLSNEGGSIGQKASEEEQPKSKCISALTFEERNKLLLKKRKEFAKAKSEPVRIFHAKPAPHFKPAAIAGTSTETLRVDNNNHSHNNVTSERKTEKLATASHIEERLRKRHEFDAKIKQKEEEELTRRKNEEAERKAMMKMEELELRKRMILKAKPMPLFKAPKIAKSAKPLTNPQTPTMIRKMRKLTE